MDHTSTAPETRPVVLIANVGSRNLKFAARELRSYFDARNNPDFARWHFERTGVTGKTRWHFDLRGLTADLLSRYDEVKDALESEIFDYLLTREGARDKVDVRLVYLLASDQPDLEHQHTDTLHEAEILRRYLLDNEVVAQAEVLVASGVNPTHEAELFAFLAPRLRALLRRFPTAIVRFCDAGGTPQMKSVTKELLRYYLPADRLQIQYPPDADATPARDVNSPLHDKYVLLTAAQGLVRSYNYAAALELLESVAEPESVGNALRALLGIAKERLNFDLTNARTAGRGQNLATLPAVLHYLAGEPFDHAVNFEDFETNYSRFSIFEIASICQLHLFRRHDLPLAVLTFIRLLEELGQCLAAEHPEVQLGRFKSYNDQQAFIDKTWSRVKGISPLLKDQYGIPYLVAFGLEFGDQELKAVFEAARPLVQYVNGKRDKGINELRNSCLYTHANQTINQAAIDQQAPDFQKYAARIFRLLDLPTTNVYDQMNDAIIALFQQE